MPLMCPLAIVRAMIDFARVTCAMQAVGLCYVKGLFLARLNARNARHARLRKNHASNQLHKCKNVFLRFFYFGHVFLRF